MKSKNISNILKSSGFKSIELDNIIESKYVLKKSGGNLSQYLFSFFDKNNNEWSLISDLSIASVKKYIQSKTNKIPGVVHVDNTSRVQTVKKCDAPKLHDLLMRWKHVSGHPVLLNTSLNVKGQPILNDKYDVKLWSEKHGIKVFS